MIPKNLKDITEDDLQVLLDNAVKEGKTIEYKRELPGNSDSDKKEFLADVSSFANASGGDLIYGIDEDNGYPKSIEGLDINDLDQRILSLEATIRSGIEPRLPSLSFKEVPLSNGKIVLVIRINKSWISPHRVTFKGHDKFYSRGANCKYPLSVDELRIAFNLSETITDRIRNFRVDRISNIIAGETPIRLIDKKLPIIILHLIPFNAFSLGQLYDISQLNAAYDNFLRPISSSCNVNKKYNLDGRVDYSVSGTDEETSTYVQIFRNGIIEAVFQYKLNGHHIEQYVVRDMPNYLTFLQKLEVGIPVFVFLSIANVKNKSMQPPDPHNNKSHKIDRDILILPEVMIESYDVEVSQVLRPCFDAMWNAGDFPGPPIITN